VEILCGARVMTMDACQPEAAAVAIYGALIVAVGSESHVRAVAGAVPVTRLPGGVLLPGFIDAHHHYAYAALAGQTAPLRTRRGSSIKELLRRIAAEAGASPAGCVYLCGYEPWDLCEQRGPRAEELDDACPDRPLFVQAANAHEGVLNTRGLQLMGWDARTPDPPNGAIVRRRGRLTGQLVEAAAFMAEARFRDEALATGERAWLAACERHGRELLSLGITRVADAAAARPVEALYQKAAQAGVLPVAVHPMPVASSDLLRPRLSGPPDRDGTGRRLRRRRQALRRWRPPLRSVPRTAGGRADARRDRPPRVVEPDARRRPSRQTRRTDPRQPGSARPCGHARLGA